MPAWRCPGKEDLATQKKEGSMPKQKKAGGKIDETQTLV
jgi:hypothetical protein